MVIFSAGYFEGVPPWPWNASNSVSPPTRPKNINRIKIICEAVPSPLVMPSEIPTVPMAEAVSNKASFSPTPSNAHKSIPHVKNRMTYIAVIAMIFKSVSSPIRLLKHSILFL